MQDNGVKKVKNIPRVDNMWCKILNYCLKYGKNSAKVLRKFALSVDDNILKVKLLIFVIL